jgi:hypothetical protein
MASISQKAIDLIVREEVSSRAYYEKHYIHPEWPGGASGVTIGIGYDLGYQTVAKIKADWTGLVDQNSVNLMLRCAGVKGGDAKSLTREVQAITVPWSAAMQVFMNRDIPQWIAAVYKALPNCDLLSQTCLGVLVSLAYNRGAGGFNSSSDRFREMRQIKDAMIRRRFEVIPDFLDSMSRLWTSGVAERRHREAALFREGLAEKSKQVTTTSVTEPDPSVLADSKPDQNARTPQPKTTTVQNGTTGLIIASSTGAAYYFGLTPVQITLAVIAAAVVAGGIWFAWYKNRNPS